MSDIYFKILVAKKDDGKTPLPHDEIVKLAEENLLSEYFYNVDTEEKRKEIIERNGLAHFFKKTEKNEKDNFSTQVENPFPVWYETATGLEYQEIMTYHFLYDDFRELQDYFNLTGYGSGSNVELTKEDVTNMLMVIDYILLEKYDRDLEELFLSNNKYIEIFDDKLLKFRNRFKKQHKKDDQKIIIIHDTAENSYSLQSSMNDDCCSDEYNNYIEEELEYEKEMRWNLENLQLILRHYLKVLHRYGDFSSFKSILIFGMTN